MPGRLNAYVLDDGEADRQLVFTAARRFCPAVVTPPMAATTPDTVLALGCAARSLTDVLSVASAELSALVCAWYWPRASVTNVARAVLTPLRSAVISLTMPVPTLTCLSVSSEARKAAASAHRTEFDGEAAEEAVVDDEGAVDDVLPGEVPLPDPHPAVSSARPHTIMTIFRRAALVTMPGFMSPTGCRAARHLSLTLGGLFPAPGRRASHLKLVYQVLLRVDRPFPLALYPWDHPLFRMKDDRPGTAMLVYRPCSAPGSRR
jgi:hypothetical protein